MLIAAGVGLDASQMTGGGRLQSALKRQRGNAHIDVVSKRSLTTTGRRRRRRESFKSTSFIARRLATATWSWTCRAAAKCHHQPSPASQLLCSLDSFADTSIR